MSIMYIWGSCSQDSCRCSHTHHKNNYITEGWGVSIKSIVSKKQRLCIMVFKQLLHKTLLRTCDSFMCHLFSNLDKLKILSQEKEECERILKEWSVGVE